MLPASWSTAIDKRAEGTTGILGIMLMACTLVVVSFSCTGPIMGTILVSVSSEKSMAAPLLGMLGFAIALAVPFTFFAFFPHLLKSLPRSGSWLNSVKVMLGFFELAFSLKFLSVADQAYHWNLLDRYTFISIWIVIFVLAGVYMLGKLRLPHDDETETVSVPRMLIATGCFSFAVYLVPGLFGAPLSIVSAFAPPLSKNDATLYCQPVHARYNDYEKALAAAKAEHKPVVFDFTGYGCVNCRKMENLVWPDADVANRLNDDYILVSLYVDDKTLLDSAMTVSENGTEKKLLTVGDKWSYVQRVKFGSNTQPQYVLMDCNGNVLNYSISYTEKVADFKSFLNQGLDNYSKINK